LCLYGLPESGKEWYDCLSSFLVESGYRQCATDNCIFFKESGNDKIIFGLHVDDKFYSSTSQALVDELIMLLTARFGSITHETGNVLSFLGMKIEKNPGTGQISISQPAFINDITQDIPHDNSPKSPATRELMDLKGIGESIDQKSYLSRVMKLMFAATKTRPDILFPVSTLASRSSDPRESDGHSLNRVYQYIRGTRGFKIQLKCSNMELSASVDASHAIHRDLKGHTGMSLFIAGCPIFSRSVKQKSVATSSTHAEILALHESIPYIIWLRDLLRELGYPQLNATAVEQDNKSALAIYDQGWSKSNKTRHIGIKYAFITEQVREGVINPKYVKTGEIRADVLTKVVPTGQFEKYYLSNMRST
jgi:hypothetical protein